MESFVEYLLRTEHVLLMVAVSATVSMTQRLFPRLEKNPMWVRVLPAIPVVLCLALVWIPGVTIGTPGEKVLIAIVLGSFAGYAHKVVKQTLFGDDKRIKTSSTGF